MADPLTEDRSRVTKWTTQTVYAISNLLDTDSYANLVNHQECVYTERWLDTYFLFFESATAAFRSAVSALKSLRGRISIGVVTADVYSVEQLEEVRQLAIGIAEIADTGQLLVSLSTQELVRRSLSSNEFFGEIGTRLISGVSTRLYIYRDNDIPIDTSLEAGSAKWNPVRFVGRQREIDTLKAELSLEKLISIYGPSGIGKTSLAARVAAEVEDMYENGVIWIELRSVSRSSLLLHRIANVLEISYFSEDTLLHRIRHKIGDGSYLLVLDDVDRLQDAIGDLSEYLIENCPNLTILCTSSKRVNASTAKCLMLKGLEHPSPVERYEDAERYDAIKFFVETARLEYPAFSLDERNFQDVAQLISMVEASPWVIQLVTSRLGVLSPQQIIGRLRDDPLAFLVDKRKPEAAFAVALSTVLNTLNPWTKELFRRLCIFQGPFSDESVQAVCADEKLPKHAVISGLKDLLDLQLIKSSELTGPRRSFVMKIASRQFSSTLCDSSERSRLRESLSRYLDERKSVLFPNRLRTETEHLEEFEILYEDYRHKWISGPKTRSSVHQAIEDAVRCGSFWFQKLYFREGLEILVYLSSQKYASSSKFFLPLLNLVSWFNIKLDAYDKARPILKQALRAALDRNDRVQVANLLNTCTAAYSDLDRKRSAVRTALTMLKFQNENDSAYANSLSSLGGMLVNAGRYREGLQMLEKSGETNGETQTWSNVSYLSNLAFAQATNSQLDAANRNLLRACELAQTHLYTESFPTLYLTGSRILIEQKSFYSAAVLLKAVQEIFEYYGLSFVIRQKNVMTRYVDMVGGEVVTGFSGWNPQSPLALLKESLEIW